MHHHAYFAVEQALVGGNGEVADIHGHVVGDDVGDAVEYAEAVDAVDFDFDEERFAQVFVPFDRDEA